jgi:hypothetical protein
MAMPTVKAKAATVVRVFTNMFIAPKSVPGNILAPAIFSIEGRVQKGPVACQRSLQRIFIVKGKVSCGGSTIWFRSGWKPLNIVTHLPESTFPAGESFSE